MSLYFDIFYVFARLSMLSLGGVFGVMPLMETYVVQDYHWISHAEFMRAYALGGFVPGPNMAMCALIGYWVAGWPGWAAALLGIYGPTLILMTLAWFVFSRYRHLWYVERTEHALRPMVLGLILASCLRFFWTFGATPVDSDLVLAPFLARVPACAVALTAIPILVKSKVKIDPLMFVFVVGFIWATLQTALLKL